MHCTPWTLTFASLAFCAVSIGALALAVGTDNWLITHEFLYAEGFFNGTKILQPLYLTTKIGLWRTCTKDNTSNDYFCLALEYTIDYHRTRQENQAISSSIAEAQLGATPFFVTSLVLALCSGVFSVMGTLQRNVKAIMSAVLSILQGLCMAVGIILYITFINDEASHAKPDTGDFQYQYSWSIILVGLAFLASQSTAIVCVTLYLKRNAKKEDMVKIIPGLEDKIKDDPEPTGVTNYSTPIF
ncbi:voltage-dependent calcium channel gamma-5 subunit-like [Argopecten irradians]|uniref:voltage-dependent calcium channel gamma-5 subunit-like n=1 Tax=Argopecten irradians TaxID=31199 RepID=UPI003711B81A